MGHHLVTQRSIVGADGLPPELLKIVQAAVPWWELRQSIFRRVDWTSCVSQIVTQIVTQIVDYGGLWWLIIVDIC